MAEIKRVETRRVSKSKSTERNPGIPLDLDAALGIRVNRSALERRASSLGKRRSIKKEWQAAWLLQAVQCIDLTTLSGDDTPGKVKRLCAKAKSPVRSEILTALGVENITTGAVCVYHNFVEGAVAELQGSNVPVAAVSTGFPAAHIPLDYKLAQIRASVADGAKEIDIVIDRSHVLTGNWRAMYEELKAYRQACGEARMKSILSTGELGTMSNIARASQVAMMAGSDFIKTSTGKEKENATIPVSLVMVRAVRDYHEKTGYMVGFKPAGGIRTAKQALVWLALIKEELGNDWLDPKWFRFGASSLLADIERQLEHFVTGRYSAFNRHPMA